MMGRPTCGTLDEERIALPMNGRSRAMSEESVPDREIARFDLSPSPAQVPVALDVSILSTPAVVPSFPSCDQIKEQIESQREQNVQMKEQTADYNARLLVLEARAKCSWPFH